jgi:hypothetical protein
MESQLNALKRKIEATDEALDNLFLMNVPLHVILNSIRARIENYKKDLEKKEYQDLHTENKMRRIQNALISLESASWNVDF